MAATAQSLSFDALFATTMQAYRKKMVDNISTSNPLYFWLTMKGRRDYQDGGTNLIVPLMYALNSTAKSYGGGYDTVDITPQDGMTVAIYPWRYLAATVSISREEERKNSGESRVIPLLQSKIEQAEISLREEANRTLYLDGTGNSNKDLFGLNLLVEDGTAWLSSVAGIDRTVETWWRNQWIGSVGSFAANGVDKMRTLFNSCTKGNLKPSIVVSTQSIYEFYEKTLVAGERFTDMKFGDAGFQNLLFKATPFVFDTYCPSGSLFMLNDQHIKLMVDTQTDFVPSGEWVRPANQIARMTQILFMGNLVIDNAARHGRLDGITA